MWSIKLKKAKSLHLFIPFLFTGVFGCEKKV